MQTNMATHNLRICKCTQLHLCVFVALNSCARDPQYDLCLRGSLKTSNDNNNNTKTHTYIVVPNACSKTIERQRESIYEHNMHILLFL